MRSLLEKVLRKRTPLRIVVALVIVLVPAALQYVLHERKVERQFRAIDAAVEMARLGRPPSHFKLIELPGRTVVDVDSSGGPGERVNVKNFEVIGEWHTLLLRAFGQPVDPLMVASFEPRYELVVTQPNEPAAKIEVATGYLRFRGDYFASDLAEQIALRLATTQPASRSRSSQP